VVNEILIGAMNRLSPMIRRQPARSFAIAAAAPGPSLNDPAADWSAAGDEDGGEDGFDQLKLFATGWVGGLIFFGTFLG
jgi:hypothetical protein